MAAQCWNKESDLIAALKSYTQADEDGVMVKVSRQACDEAADRIAALERALAAAQAERDLAIAHDRQPYPTAHAYEQACKALEAARADAAALRAAIESARPYMMNPAHEILDAAIDAARKEGGNG